MGELPDVQGSTIKDSFGISRVGIQGIMRPVSIKRPGKTVNLIPTLDISVNLPSDQKGSHMSRHVEVINRAVEMAINVENDSLERLVERIALELLKSHEYATYADVSLWADYFMKKRSPDERSVTENYRIFAEARIRRGDPRPERTIGVEVSGMSACPCAMETVRTMLKNELIDDGASPEEVAILDKIPVPTHNQRNRTYIGISWDRELHIDAEDLISLVEGILSSATYEILKRKGEGEIVLKAHKNPKFVEDIVRELIEAFLERYPGISGDASLKVRSVSEESIHKHDAFAERVAPLSELRKSTRFA
ncbi:MAG: GTP cyclohydrolase MptA [Thermoplasmatota archaeon]